MATGASFMTSTSKLCGADVLPAAVGCVHVTVVIPSGYVSPELKSQLTAGAGSTASVADGAGVNVTAAPDELVAGTVCVGRHPVRTGAVVS